MLSNQTQEIYITSSKTLASVLHCSYFGRIVQGMVRVPDKIVEYGNHKSSKLPSYQ